MSITIQDIRSRLANDHKVVNVNKDGVDVPLTDSELEKWFDEQAEILFVNAHGWENLRQKRNSMLSESDWTQVADAPVNALAWAKYRQALRDLPATIKNPMESFEWPEPPK